MGGLTGQSVRENDTLTAAGYFDVDATVVDSGEERLFNIDTRISRVMKLGMALADRPNQLLRPTPLIALQPFFYPSCLLDSDALDGFGITECGSLACLSSPCRNGAACIKIESNELDENGDKAEKWKCKCPTGYMGPTCEISVCEDNPCQYGGTCVQFPGSGYLCLCPLGKHGHYCEHSE